MFLVLIARALAGIFKVPFLSSFQAQLLIAQFKQTQELSRLALINQTLKVNRARAIGLFNSIGSAGFILGPTIGGHLREYIGENGFYLCARLTGAVFILNFAIVFIFMSDQKKSTKDQKLKPVAEELNNNNRPSIMTVLMQMWDLCTIRLWWVLTQKYLIPKVLNT